MKPGDLVKTIGTGGAWLYADPSFRDHVKRSAIAFTSAHMGELLLLVATCTNELENCTSALVLTNTLKLGWCRLHHLERVET